MDLYLEGGLLIKMKIQYIMKVLAKKGIMEITFKKESEILYKLLHDRFLVDFEKGLCCPSDSIIWYRKDKESMNLLFKKWLVRNEFAFENES